MEKAKEQGMRGEVAIRIDEHGVAHHSHDDNFQDRLMETAKAQGLLCKVCEQKQDELELCRVCKRVVHLIEIREVYLRVRKQAAKWNLTRGNVNWTHLVTIADWLELHPQDLDEDDGSFDVERPAA